MSDKQHIGHTLKINLRTGEHTLKPNSPNESPAAPSSLVVSSYHASKLPEWSDEKLQANIKASEEQVDAGTGDDFLDYECEVFLSGLLQEDERRKCAAKDQALRSVPTAIVE